MRKIKILAGLLLLLLIPAAVIASTFNSQQLANTPSNGQVLQTNGSTNSWVSTSSLGFVGGVSSFNTRTGAITLTSGDVTTALTFTPYNATNPSGYITSAGAPVQSVFSRTGAVTAQSGDYTTAQVTESGNLYFTNARAQNAITLTTTGSSGAATYTGGTLNIPQYSGGTTGVQLPTYVVAASGGNFTTIQGALDACGTANGGNIVLTDKTYSIGSTGLLWKGSNCAIYGRGPGTTTIAFTGATTAIKTNSAAGQFTHDEIHNVFFSGPANTTSVAIDWSDMTHGIVDNVQTSAVGTSLVLNDTQGITFYNSFTNLDFNDNHAFCINASSTNPVNGNKFENIFCGDAATTNVVGLQLNNANGNSFHLIYLEPQPTPIAGTVGLKIFDNKIATNNGVFNNDFSDLYIEGNVTGVSIVNTVNPTMGGIQRNTLTNITNETNTIDWSITPGAAALNNINGYDSNFTNPITVLQGPVGIATSTELQSIGTTPYSFFGVNASSTVATNEFVIDNNTSGNIYRTDLLMNNIGYLGLNTTNPTSRLTVADLTSADAVVPTVSLTGDTNFAKTAPILKVSNNNASDSGTTTQIINLGTGPSFDVEDQANDLTPFIIDSSGYVGIGTTTPSVPLTLSSTTATTQFLINRPSGSFTGATGFDMNVGSSRLGAANDFRLVTGIGLDGSFLSSSEKFTVLKGGNVGISTSTPYATLSVQSNASTGDAFVIATTTGRAVMGVDNDGHQFTSGPAPAISSCGTGIGTVVGDDQGGTITTATAATACTMTFSKAYQNTPYCMVTDNSLVGFADISSVSVNAVTFGISSALTGGNLYYQCAYHK